MDARARFDWCRVLGAGLEVELPDIRPQLKVLIGELVFQIATLQAMNEALQRRALEAERQLQEREG